MNDRTTRGTPAFDSLLWDTSSIPPLDEAPRAKALITAPRPAAVCIGCALIYLASAAIALVAFGNVAVWIIEAVSR